MKDSSPNQELFQYYDERAPEYEDFYQGKFPAKVPDPAIYQNDTLAIQKLLPDYISGNCIDIACGTGFWLPVYQKNCSRITLIDQSAGVLAECTRKIRKLGIESQTETIRGDLFRFPFKKHEFDSAFIGFLISHFTPDEADSFFSILKKLLMPGGRLAIIDSVWGDVALKRGRDKAGITKRILSNGREFDIYKRYFEKPDLQDLAGKFGINLDIVYWGKVFFLAAGNLSRKTEA